MQGLQQAWNGTGMLEKREGAGAVECGQAARDHGEHQ
jgi:hypothetical protein